MPTADSSTSTPPFTWSPETDARLGALAREFQTALASHYRALHGFVFGPPRNARHAVWLRDATALRGRPFTEQDLLPIALAQALADVQTPRDRDPQDAELMAFLDEAEGRTRILDDDALDEALGLVPPTP